MLLRHLLVLVTVVTVVTAAPQREGRRRQRGRGQVTLGRLTLVDSNGLWRTAGVIKSHPESVRVSQSQ